MAKKITGFISDVHANEEALRLVLDHIKEHYGDITLYCLGDVVDNGPAPRECIQLVRERCDVVLAGNHDLAACGDKSCYNDLREGLRGWSDWTSAHLSRADKKWLRSLPTQYEENGFVMAHAMACRGPSRHESAVGEYFDWRRTTQYIGLFKNFNDYPADEIFSYLQELYDIDGRPRIEIHGHTHSPYIFPKGGAANANAPEVEELLLETRNRPCIVNVPSVGMPREYLPGTRRLDERTGYVIIEHNDDVNSIVIHRLPLDLESHLSACAKIDKDERPSLTERLSLMLH